MGTYSYEEAEYGKLAAQTQKMDVEISDEVQASQEDQEVLSIDKNSPIDRENRNKNIVKLDSTNLVAKDEVRHDLFIRKSIYPAHLHAL